MICVYGPGLIVALSAQLTSSSLSCCPFSCHLNPVVAWATSEHDLSYPD